MRDGARAVQMAQDVIERGGATPVLLRTLAAAYAEAGRFSEAIAAANEAGALASQSGDAALQAQLQSLVRDFEIGLPLRDRSLAGVRPVSLP